MDKQKLSRFEGPAFSLLEVILVLGLLAVITVSLVVFLGGSLFSVSRSESIQQATSLAQEQIEQILQAKIPITEGVFDGQLPSPQTATGFPPAPYPGKKLGRDYWLKVTVVKQSERLFTLSVVVSDDEREVVNLETLYKK